jgi:hypothetical protein
MSTIISRNPLNINTLSGLQGDTGYELRMFAENRIDRSPVTDIKLISTMPSVVKGMSFRVSMFCSIQNIGRNSYA